MNPRVSAVTPAEGQALLLHFNNGERRRMDLSRYLPSPVSDRMSAPSATPFTLHLQFD